MQSKKDQDLDIFLEKSQCSSTFQVTIRHYRAIDRLSGHRNEAVYADVELVIINQLSQENCVVREKASRQWRRSL